MKKLSFFLMAMLFTCATTLQAAEVTETIAMKGFGGLTTTSYENVTKTGTSDLGTEMVAYAFNPSNGQVRGNKTTIAGASVTTADKNKNWSLYNTQAMPGAIKKITVTQTATGSNVFKGSLFVALGTTNQGSVTTVTGAQKNTTGTATEFTFDIEETQGYTYFKLLSNVAFTSNSVAGVVVTVTYVTAEGGEEEVTKYTVTANVNDPAMGAVSGAGEYAEGKTATLTANANAGYRFVNWSNGSTDNPLKITVTENIEITANFEAVPPMTCAEAAAAASGATVVLNPFDVVAVVKGAGYIYIKDESGVALIYDFTMDDQLKAGDHVEGFVGVSSPYNGLPELKPSVAFADLTVTPGTAPEPTLFTEAPVKADVNKYVKFENVTLTADATFTTESATNATMVVNGTNVTLRNTFKLAATLSADKAYNIVGFVAIYNSSIQVYFLSAEEYVAPVVNHTITVSANPAEGGVVTGGGEFEETDEITVKAVANDGYEFVNWTENEVEVSTDAEYTFEVLADRALVANFKEAEPEIEWIEMPLEISNLTTMEMPVEGVTYLQLTGRNDKENADVMLFLNNYTGEEKAYEVNAESALMTFGGSELTVIDGSITKSVDPELGDVFAGIVHASAEEEGATMYVEFDLKMYALPPIAIELEDVEIVVNEESAIAFFNATWEGSPLQVEVSGFEEVEFKEYPECWLSIGDDVNWVDAAAGPAAVIIEDGVAMLEGEFTSFSTGKSYEVMLTGTLPVKEEPALKGVVKRAVQLGESVVVLTHEADSTAHIYNVVGENISEVSQEGVVPVDPEDEFDYLAISDIAVTEDGKLVATNYTRCNFGSTTYGTSYFYLWNDLDADPTIWFQSNASSNSTYSDQGYTMAVKGTSTNAVVMTTGVHNKNRGVRMSQYTIIDGVYEDINNAGGFKTSDYYFLFGLTDNVVFNENNSGTNLELNALGENWVMDGNLIEPTEWAVPETMSENHIVKGVIAEGTLGKKYNGATYVTVGNQVLMVAPYADAEGKLAGVKILDVTAGFAAATEVAVADLDAAVEATAAATAVAVAENTLTITLVGDATLYTLTAELTQDPGPGTALENIAVEGKAVKAIVNGQLIIIKNGVQYNAQGQVVK